jgi:thiol:disulfide interchange protein DsbD
MSAVLFAFALSLLGVFSIELPGAAAQGLDRFQRREGPAGAFFGGVLATVLATPCTAPLLGPALGFAFSQPPAVVFGFFMAIAAGLATPYVALSANPALLQFIPKPGPWMETFKKFLGLVLIGFVIWLLWVLGAQTGADGVIVALAFLFAVGVACMIFGWGFDLRAGHFRRWGTAMAAIALAAGAYAAMPGAYIAGLEREKARDEVGARQVVWEPFSYARVNELAAEGRPIFVDFTADWCLTCKVNENLILSRDDVEAEFLKHDFATLKVDWTNRDPEIALLLQRFGRAGVPMYLIFPAGRPSDYRLLPETFTPGMAIEALREAGLS